MPATPREIAAICKVVTEETAIYEQLEARRQAAAGGRDQAVSKLAQLAADVAAQIDKVLAAQAELRELLARP
jgi:hypothetical protein